MSDPRNKLKSSAVYIERLREEFIHDKDGEWLLWQHYGETVNLSWTQLVELAHAILKADAEWKALAAIKEVLGK